jgi:hypothetical protein
VWFPSFAGLRGTGLRSEYCAGLCRPWGHGPAEMEIMRVCISSGRLWGRVLAEQRSYRSVQAWESGGMAWWRCKCLWIPGLKGSSHGDPAVLRGGSLG